MNFLRGWVLLLALRLALGGAFLWAGMVKVFDPGLFAQTVRAYDVLPIFVINSFAIVVPWIEVVTGICLVTGFWTRSSALIVLMLLLCFGAALGVNLHRDATLSCGCFGMNGTNGSLYAAMLRDVFMIFCTSMILFLNKKLFLSISVGRK